MRYFYESIVVSLFFLSLLVFPSFSSASVDLKNDIAALKGEIKTAQEKLDNAKPGQTLEAITLPASIKNMQKILGSLSQKAGGDQNLSGKVKNLNSSLNSLEGAKNKNDKPEAQKILNEMAVAIIAFEKETVKPPPGKVGGADTIAYGEGIDLVIASVELIHCSVLGKPGNIMVIRPSVKNMWRGETSSHITIDVEGMMLTGRTGERISYSCIIRGGIGPNEEKKADWCGQIDVTNLTFADLNIIVDKANVIRENNNYNNRCSFRYWPTSTKIIIHRCPIQGPHEPPPE